MCSSQRLSDETVLCVPEGLWVLNLGQCGDFKGHGRCWHLLDAHSMPVALIYCCRTTSEFWYILPSDSNQLINIIFLFLFISFYLMHFTAHCDLGVPSVSFTSSLLPSLNIFHFLQGLAPVTFSLENSFLQSLQMLPF